MYADIHKGLEIHTPIFICFVHYSFWVCGAGDKVSVEKTHPLGLP